MERSLISTSPCEQILPPNTNQDELPSPEKIEINRYIFKIKFNSSLVRGNNVYFTIQNKPGIEFKSSSFKSRLGCSKNLHKRSLFIFQKSFVFSLNLKFYYSSIATSNICQFTTFGRKSSQCILDLFLRSRDKREANL